ncbi:MAG: DnaD domain protein [Treponemataceae bacterium]
MRYITVSLLVLLVFSCASTPSDFESSLNISTEKDFEGTVKKLLSPEEMKYLAQLCDEYGLEKDLVFAILTVDIKLSVKEIKRFRLHPYYLTQDFIPRFWDKKEAFDNSDFTHNAYVAVKLLRYIKDKTQTEKDIILGYEYGITRYLQHKPYPEKTTTEYYNEVKNLIDIARSK